MPRKLVRCYNCKKKGHFRRDFPMLKGKIQDGGSSSNNNDMKVQKC